MSTPAVQEFCGRVWDLRGRKLLPGATALSRGLALAVAADVLAAENYDPYEDRRVEWAQGVIRSRTWLRPDLRPEADGNLEYLVGMMLGRAPEPVLCGKARAAGEREDADLFSSLKTENLKLATQHP